MNEVVNSGVMNIASLVVSVVVLLIGLILWFFINRASSRTNEQIELLEASVSYTHLTLPTKRIV